MELDIVKVLQSLRLKLLNENNKSLYYEIYSFLAHPTEVLDTINKSINLTNLDISEDYINCLKDELYNLYINNNDFYRENIIDGQCDIWGQMYETYFKLLSYKGQLENISIDYVGDRYTFACEEVEKIINIVSSSYCIIVNFEEIMGLDRFLSCINQQDIELLYDQIQVIKRIANKKLERYKDIYQKEWNLSSISRLLVHMLVKEDYKSSIARNFPSEQQNVILLVVDGLGYSQYLWSIFYEQLTRKYTFNENILNWLEGNKDFYKFIIGSSLISDTGSGLSQIFTGNLPKDTGVISSKVYREDCYRFYPQAYRYKSPIIDVKNTIANFDKIAVSETNVFDSLSTHNIKSEVYYCSNYRNNPFSELCFGQAHIHRVLPPDRVFSVLFENLDENEQGVLNTVYYTSLDNTGHPTGSFTLFELYEHKKFNSLFTNFLIQLAMNKPNLFNGKTSIVITADHGMAESSKKVISRREFETLYPEFIKNKYSIIENNRALLFYNVNMDKLNEAKHEINEIFKKHKIDVDIFTKEDPIMIELMYDNDSISSINCPDIIALIKSEGIIYSQNINKHLYHYGGHGGRSVEEVFVPLIGINLTEQLKAEIENRFFKLM